MLAVVRRGFLLPGRCFPLSIRVLPGTVGLRVCVCIPTGQRVHTPYEFYQSQLTRVHDTRFTSIQVHESPAKLFDEHIDFEVYNSKYAAA